MASFARAWTPGAFMCFGSLDFIATTGGRLELTHAPVRPLPTVDLDSTIEALQELWMRAPKAPRFRRRPVPRPQP